MKYTTYMKMINSKPYRYLIIGASQAGMTAAEKLRELDSQGSILLLSEETFIPYKRTKLSKSLNKTLGKDPFALKDQNWFSHQQIDLLLGSTALEIIPGEHSVILQDNTKVNYEKLLLAIGSKPRKLPITGGEYIHYLHDLKDMLHLQASMISQGTALVIGGGVEGVELADQFKKAGLEIILLSRGSQPMNHWLDLELSQRLRQILENSQIEQIYNDTAKEIIWDNKGYTVYTSRGKKLRANLIAASTGTQSRRDITGIDHLYGERGLKVKMSMETDEENIYGAGDVLELPPIYPWGLWHSAEYQAKVAAINMFRSFTKEKSCPKEIDKRSFRLKAEVFDQFYFSQGDIADSNSSQILIDDGNRYLKIFLHEGQVKGCIMANMKGIAKSLQKMIQNGVTADKILQELS